jgi:uncharacterized protein (DUF488 family)
MSEQEKMKEWVKFYRRLKTMGVNGLSQNDLVLMCKKLLEQASFEFSYQQKKERITLATKVLVADVRQNPNVKECFRPKDLELALEANGIEYKRYPSLGNPFYREKDLKPGEIKKKYLNYLRTNEQAKKEINDLLSEFEFQKIIVLICYCKSQTECHRFWLREVLINKMRARLNFALVTELTN